MLWDLLLQYQVGQLGDRLDRMSNDAATNEATVRTAGRLNDKVDRLALLCQAMFELMQQTSGVTEEQFKAKIAEIDIRDGQADGRITPKPKRCPKCGAMVSPRFGRCLFCNYHDESAGSVVT
ncbi:MAG TPA: hypothetical protein VH138_04600 [Vicinamibacterales bacterium]|nr:hypothetical protein [Vicinamibacterales bacterium]